MGNQERLYTLPTHPAQYAIAIAPYGSLGRNSAYVQGWAVLGQCRIGTWMCRSRATQEQLPSNCRAYCGEWKRLKRAATVKQNMASLVGPINLAEADTRPLVLTADRLRSVFSVRQTFVRRRDRFPNPRCEICWRREHFPGCALKH